MTKILIADKERDAARLSKLLAEKHELQYADTVAQLMEKATKDSYDLLIIGALSDQPNMFNVVRMVLDTPAISTTPVLGFSDEHTEGTDVVKDSLGRIMSCVGARDHIETRDLSDTDLIERIEACLNDESKSIQRHRQESLQLSKHAVGLTDLAPFNVLLISDDDAYAENLEKGLALDIGIQFDIQQERSLGLGLQVLTVKNVDAIICDFDCLQMGDSFLAIHPFAPNTPLIGLTKTASDCSMGSHQGKMIRLMRRADSDGLKIAFSILEAISQRDTSNKRETSIAAFLVRELQTALKSVNDELPQQVILQNFSSHLEEFGRSLDDDILVSVLLIDQIDHTLHTAAAPSLPPTYTAMVNGLRIGECVGSCGTAAYRGEPVYVSDIENDLLWKEFRSLVQPYGLKACWSIPIFDNNANVVATFAIYHRTPRLPTIAEQILVSAASTVVTNIFRRSKISVDCA